MIVQIYNGKSRGFGRNDEGGWVKIGFDFREYMHHFKGAKLSVLLCLILHSDEEGRSWPSYPTIMKETGLSRQSIATTLKELCHMNIDGQRILLRYQSPHISKFKGSNHYVIFPSKQEVIRWEPNRITVEVVKKLDFNQSNNLTTPVKKLDLKKNQLSKTTDSINLRESFKQKKKKSKVQIDPDFQDYLNHRGL